MSAHHTRIETELGEITLAANEGRLTGLYFRHHRYKPPQEVLGPYVEPDTDPLFTHAAAELEDYLAGRRTSFDVPIAAVGDEFQERVWTLLEEIPYGGTTTYGTLAEKVGDRSLAQEVGRAVGHNPLSVIVPCHRVVGKDGKLTGYAGGLRRKRFLLDLEEPSQAKTGRLF